LKRKKPVASNVSEPAVDRESFIHFICITILCVITISSFLLSVTWLVVTSLSILLCWLIIVTYRFRLVDALDTSTGNIISMLFFGLLIIVQVPIYSLFMNWPFPISIMISVLSTYVIYSLHSSLEPNRGSGLRTA